MVLANPEETVITCEDPRGGCVTTGIDLSELKVLYKSEGAVSVYAREGYLEELVEYIESARANLAQSRMNRDMEQVLVQAIQAAETQLEAELALSPSPAES